MRRHLALVAQDIFADRAGLSSFFAPYGQGYGFGGERDQNGNIASGLNASPTALGSQNIPLASQYAIGQDIYQRDVNDMQWRFRFPAEGVRGELVERAVPVQEDRAGAHAC